MKMHRIAMLVLSAALSALPAIAADKPAEAPAAKPAANWTAEPAKEREGLPLVFHETFADGEAAMKRFDLINPGDWKMGTADGKPVMSLFQRPTEKSAGKPPVRSPFGRAIVKDLVVSEFVMEVKFKSTIKAYGHQDLCLFFGEKDVSHLYYVHFGRNPDPNAGNIFIVNGAPRKNLLPPHKKTVDWTEGWHTATVERKADGTIKISFDGQPYLEVNDKTFPTGRVGVGSFDDTGDFAEIRVWGKKE
jgi:hypothetical protein